MISCKVHTGSRIHRSIFFCGFICEAMNVHDFECLKLMWAVQKGEQLA
jgi:hypothetical protein